MTPTEALKKLRQLAIDNKVPVPAEGICVNAKRLYDESFKKPAVSPCFSFIELVREISGSSYPIEESFEAYLGNKSKWKGIWLTKRLALLDQLIVVLNERTIF